MIAIADKAQHRLCRRFRKLAAEHKPAPEIAVALQMTPHRDEGYYTFTGTGTLLPVIAGAVPQSVASPMPASWNRIVTWLQQIVGLRRAA